jgi:hypothetical protein
VFDNSKIKRLVPEFTCKVDWSDGLQRALAWFDAHPAYQTLDNELDRIWDTIIDAYEHLYP